MSVQLRVHCLISYLATQLINLTTAIGQAELAVIKLLKTTANEPRQEPKKTNT